MFNPNPAQPLALLRECPAYQPSPLVNIHTALGSNILVKNERLRLGLGSFKGLGGIYAVAKLIAEQWESSHDRLLKPSEFFNPSISKTAQDITFVCASAGNHGIAVAVGARLFGAKSRVYLAKNVPEGFASKLRLQYAEVIYFGDTYEEAMAAAITDAKTSSLLLSDSSWPGYEYAPALIMEGYTVIAAELKMVFQYSGDWPTHVYLQAGVGGFAGAITYMIRNTWPIQPSIIIVEPEAAPCLQKSIHAGYAIKVKGPVSNMGRLDCKQPSIIALDILQKAQVEYMTISDEEAKSAAEYLNKNKLSTTPSGAAGFAGLLQSEHCYLTSDVYRPLMFITENSLDSIH